MRVAICEDDQYHRELIFNAINNFALFHELSIEIVFCTDNPNKLLQIIQSKQIDCYILDIELNEVKNGMIIAIAIREKDPLAHIIFVTTHALDFIVKNYPNKLR
ncbi:response regulator [Solibacillus sp. CAU 1738]|uniref:response regulator n=1 Tax=Solibacillus sp. CAU 1738 TaxID=3140363 RepID=UPI00326118D2